MKISIVFLLFMLTNHNLAFSASYEDIEIKPDYTSEVLRLESIVSDLEHDERACERYSGAVKLLRKLKDTEGDFVLETFSSPGRELKKVQRRLDKIIKSCKLK